MAISINGISYKYDDTLVLDSLSFKIEEGLITGIYGDNASGKSTIAKILSNIITPYNGNINSLGFNIDSKSKSNIKYKRKIGYLSQKINTYFKSDNVVKEITFILKNNKYTKEQIDKRIEELLQIFELDKGILNKNISLLNMNEKRILSILCCIATNPDLIILDEPFIGLDETYKKKIVSYLKMLKNDYKKTIVILSNDIDKLIKVVDDLVIIKNGTCVTYGKKIDVISNIDVFEKNEIQLPGIIEFSKTVKDKKNIKVGYYDDIKDLMKAVYRNV